ncbi:SDR family oxidoreductase [Chelativorans sp. ZYF759]|uniref:SDR family NAD(P)-dependent oxidoreductase n=1 Tax=Chelativorans sp. ZYF759 TaxID=2692213 RepID=UPI00145EF5AE|nr:SDR family oxidoreductase [Chelativorans sp. ZYF759]NMG41667.1 SDR family oxidoreductase [Chelativorans sp. ZYF759]
MTEGSARRVSVVMGGAGGIGSATCRSLALAGQHVIVVDLSSERSEAVATEIRGAGLSADAEACDATDRAAVDALRERIEVRHGLVDVLVNLAGVVRNDILVKVKDEDFSLTMATHLNSTLNSMRVFLPSMRKRGYGRVVNTSSTAARGTFGGASYAAAKGAIEALSRTAAFELAKSGVTVNCVAPGLIGTGIFLTVPDDYRQQAIDHVPMGRAGEAEEVAACIRFLASSDAGYVTGQTLYVCGGLTIGPV